MPKHLRHMFDFSADDIMNLFERTAWMKKELKAGRSHRPLEGKTLAMVFEKSSTRTRVSFEVGMFQLGGHALNITTAASQLGRGETYQDTARVLSRYVDAIMHRTFEQSRLEEMVEGSSVPVINGLSDLYHPCQVLTDLFTVSEHKENITNLKIAYVGDGNNMCNSWINAALILGFELSIACPSGYEVPHMMREKIQQLGKSEKIHIGNDAVAAVKSADVINTDTWISMGQEGEDVEAKKKLFMPYQVNAELLSHAAKDAIVLHCLPAHRNEEITDEVMDGPQSRIFDEAENRLHVQKAILEKLILA
ncbi:MAG: ornithine carbamoyltransferase [Deltaproteobacteria bacterium CG11_big_fil_rev_8_21_14_0_20_42_23]|nr:MAG: ornithine carbamoyltransferase [Deltaproteobacteria bacterium CG11_big_fil_rev_8_21_14_0_20_42_23]PJC64359.1 MAG: ornithine carbamoyltransferase [Deltaproteobacteria bacterium CG_4_9_14_0_2_um_filter_42_21]